ncbi:MAG TPA: helicase-associated domain-containing protein [Ktedonobacteraceae bacterium]
MANMTAALRKALQACSVEELARIGNSWAVANVTAESWPGPYEAVDGQGLLDIHHARFAWEALSLNAREILHQMIIFKILDGVPREDLQTLSGLSQADFSDALAELEHSVILIETRPDSKVGQRLEARGQQVSMVLAIPKDFHATFATVHEEIYGVNGDRSKMPLDEVLATLDPIRFQFIDTISSKRFSGSNFVLYTTSTTPASLAGKLVQVESIELLWDKLENPAQQICRWLCQGSGNADVTQAQSALNLTRLDMARYIYRLESHGLAFTTFSGQDFKIFIGRGILKVLRKFIEELDQFLEQTALGSALPIELETAPSLIYEAHGQLLADLAIVINAVYQTVIEPTQAGYVPKRVANKIAPLMHGSRFSNYDETDIYLDMVFSLAQSLGLIYLKHSSTQKSRYEPGPNLAKWIDMGTTEQTASLLHIWREGLERNWSDVAGLNYNPAPFGFYMDSRAAREGLLTYVAQHCQPDKWYALSPWLQNIKTNNLLLIREFAPRYSTYDTPRNRKNILANWDTSDGEIITGMLASSMYELGLVTLGVLDDAATQPRNPDAIQFTELAARVIWGVQAPETSGEPARALIVQPNFELLLLQPDYSTLYKLLPFSKVKQIELVSQLTLTQESVRRGVEAGLSVEQIIQTLQACSQKELPQNVLYTLQDWGRLYKDATVSQVILLEVSNEAVADEICASTKLRALELRRVGPRAIALGAQASLQVLRTTLEKEGIILHIQGDILSSRDVTGTTTSGYGRRR